LISQNIIFYCSFYKENNNNNKRNTQREDKWEAPGEGLLMINTDGATFAGERGAGLGVVMIKKDLSSQDLVAEHQAHTMLRSLKH
jgi:hypothetical protein